MHLMRRLFLPAAEAFQDACWRPSTDVYRTPEGWLVKLDLAGVRQGDFSMSFAGRRLRVMGVRRDRSMDEECHCYRLEIAYSRFEREIELPVELDPACIDMEYRGCCWSGSPQKIDDFSVH
jgi:HSP20 family protein